MHRLGTLLVLATTLVLGSASAAQASHHLFKVNEVYAGSAGNPGVQFVELLTPAANQGVMAGRHLRFYDVDGTLTSTATYPADTSQVTQTTVLAATAGAASYFGVSPELTLTGSPIDPLGGRVCFVTPSTNTVRDCVAWGEYDATASNFGQGEASPAPAIAQGTSLARDLAKSGGATTLEAGDDTNVNSADFLTLTRPTPKNNAEAVTSTAGTAGLIGSTFTVRPNAVTDPPNAWTTAAAGGQQEVDDTSAPLVAGTGCTQARVDAVRCPDGAVTRLLLEPGAGGDVVDARSTTKKVTIRGAAGTDTLRGGSGADVLSGGDEADVLFGGPGDDAIAGDGGMDALLGEDGKDALSGGDGDDELQGQASNDVLDGGAGADVMTGGDGTDLVQYRGRAAAVSASIDGVANDGGSADGRKDAIGSDVEDLAGGKGADKLTGDAGVNTIDGGFGADVLTGGGGADVVRYDLRTAGVTVSLDGVANDGNADDGTGDTLVGFASIEGGAGDDVLTGNASANRLRGGLGADRLFGLGANDQLFAGDGLADLQIDCGAGPDVAIVDLGVDPMTSSCETVK